jgi:hypothetical protein
VGETEILQGLPFVTRRALRGLMRVPQHEALRHSTAVVMKVTDIWGRVSTFTRRVLLRNVCNVVSEYTGSHLKTSTVKI